MGLVRLIALSGGLAARDCQCLGNQKGRNQKAGREAENFSGMGVIQRASSGIGPGENDRQESLIK